MRPPTIELKALEQSADIDHHRLLICTTQCHFGREGIGVWGLDCPPQSAQQSYSPTELGPRERAAVFAASAARGGNFSSSEMPRRREVGRECTVCSTSSSMWTKVLHAAQPVIAVVGVTNHLENTISNLERLQNLLLPPRIYSTDRLICGLV